MKTIKINVSYKAVPVRFFTMTRNNMILVLQSLEGGKPLDHDKVILTDEELKNACFMEMGL